jgi:hypothetical protein
MFIPLLENGSARSYKREGVKGDQDTAFGRIVHQIPWRRNWRPKAVVISFKTLIIN